MWMGGLGGRVFGQPNIRLASCKPRGISLLQKSVRDFFRTKGFLRISDGFFLQTKGFLPKAYEIFWSEMPLGANAASKDLV